MRHSLTLLSMAIGSTITLCYQLAQQWIAEGYGVNPIFAGGYIVAIFFAPIVITTLLNSADRIRAEDTDKD